MDNSSPRVRLINLKTASMNGKCGTRGEWKQDKGRFAVHLDNGLIKGIKPENLEIIVAKKVRKYRCTYCRAEYTHSKTLSTCGKCRTVAYCNGVCQRKDWKNHKEDCKIVCTQLKERPGVDVMGGHQAGWVSSREKELEALLHPPLINPITPGAMIKYNKSKAGKRMKKFLIKLKITKQTVTSLMSISTVSFSKRLLPIYQLENRGRMDTTVVFEKLSYAMPHHLFLLDSKDGLSLLDYFVKIGGDLGKYDPLIGYSLLHQAAKFGQVKAMAFLVEAGMNPNIPTAQDHNNMGTSSTPLHLAAMYCQPESVKYLCSLENIEVDTLNSTGATAMHWAMTQSKSSGVPGQENMNATNQKHILDMLKARGANVNKKVKGDLAKTKNANGMSPLDMGQHAGNASGMDWAKKNGLKNGNMKAGKKMNKDTVSMLRQHFPPETHPEYQDTFDSLERGEPPKNGSIAMDMLMGALKNGGVGGVSSDGNQSGAQGQGCPTQ